MRTRVALIVLLASTAAWPQTPEPKFIADTLIVQADGTYETDPDLATMSFQIFSQDKELKKAYDAATQSIQRISALAANNGLSKEDVRTGVLTVAPIYEGDRKKRARAYYVQGAIELRVHDFSRIGPILDGSVDDAIADFRSITYSLSNEEAAKKQAVAVAMRNAIGRASSALEQKGQKLGDLRYMSVDVKQLYGIAQLQASGYTTLAEANREANGGPFPDKTPPPPPPPPQPQRIAVSASVQCAFQIE